MFTQQINTKESKREAVANVIVQKMSTNKKGIELVDNRQKSIQLSNKAGNRNLSKVIQLMSDEEQEIFMKRTEEISDKLQLKGFERWLFLGSAKIIAKKTNINLSDAMKELEIEVYRTELSASVSNKENEEEDKLAISESIASMFFTSTQEVIQRYVGPFRDEKGNLPPDFYETVKKWAELGARDIEPIFTNEITASLVNREPNKMKFMNRLDEYISANIDFGDFYGKKEKELGNVIHFIWSGRPISEGALQNILKWQERAKGTPWQVILWSDQAISKWEKTRPLLNKAGIKLYDVTDIVDPRFKEAYALARQYNLAGAADLIRLSLLNRFGGAYVDVDIGPGEADLNEFETPTHLQRPILAPGIRDEKGVRNLLNIPEGIPITKAHVKRAANLQRLSDQANNNFIASAPGAMALTPIINHVAKNAGSLDKDAWADGEGFIAGVTGPMAIGGVLEKMTAKGQLEKSKSITNLSLEWLTPESEDQNWTSN
ncbi:glycosyltransferase [Tenacibaculum sp. TC6]|uniref:glycosyltransferase n=1 Tax=Tenacibaculum sp. TC6 TaxID=3423223 RepID=UPI003D361A7C